MTHGGPQTCLAHEAQVTGREQREASEGKLDYLTDVTIEWGQAQISALDQSPCLQMFLSHLERAALAFWAGVL